ncbi:MAG TPA: AMIN domain-containing protein [Candidatus Solibacter sp.]|nr:AMIN domain-containing protein [Candidatus Solibacter sp.]
MKTAMKLSILAVALTAAGAAFAQNTDAIDNARSIAKSLQQKQANDTNAALDAAGVTQAPSKPAPGAPAPAIKPAVIPSSKPAVVQVKPAVKPSPAPKVATEASDHIQLQHVNVKQDADGVQIELSTSDAVTPKVTKLSSPARVLIELPETVVASAQNKIAVDKAGVKGVRIGMDGKNPPTTSVVVDLEKPLAYELVPSADGKVVLALHTQESAPVVAKTAPAPAKSSPVKAAPAPAKATVASASAKPAAPAPSSTTQLKTLAAKPSDTTVKVATVKDSKAAASKTPEKKEQAKSTPEKPATTVAAAPAEAAKPEKPKPEEKKWAMNGKRDPFFSPVVQQSGSGCSTGKKCLEIGNINLRGVVKSDNGFIAVVTNNLNKAYFLRENDPVFNGYVVRITGDSVVFQETIQDKLGKPFTREVVKRIFTPAV